MKNIIFELYNFFIKPVEPFVIFRKKCPYVRLLRLKPNIREIVVLASLIQVPLVKIRTFRYCKKIALLHCTVYGKDTVNTDFIKIFFFHFNTL